MIIYQTQFASFKFSLKRSFVSGKKESSPMRIKKEKTQSIGDFLTCAATLSSCCKQIAWLLLRYFFVRDQCSEFSPKIISFGANLYSPPDALFLLRSKLLQKVKIFSEIIALFSPRKSFVNMLPNTDHVTIARIGFIQTQSFLLPMRMFQQSTSSWLPAP